MADRNEGHASECRGNRGGAAVTAAPGMGDGVLRAVSRQKHTHCKGGVEQDLVTGISFFPVWGLLLLSYM